MKFNATCITIAYIETIGKILIRLNQFGEL